MACSTSANKPPQGERGYYCFYHTGRNGEGMSALYKILLSHSEKPSAASASWNAEPKGFLALKKHLAVPEAGKQFWCK